MTPPSVLDYQPRDRRRNPARIACWVGVILSVLGTVVMLVALLEDLRYYHSYPALDIALFALGIAAAPALGLILSLSARAALRGSRRGRTVAAVTLMLLAAGCVAVAIAAVIEAAECAAGRAFIDAAITATGGAGVTLAAAFLLLWLAGRVAGSAAAPAGDA